MDTPQVPDGVYDVVPVAEEFRLLDTATVMQLGAGLVTPAAVDDAFTTTKRTRGRPMRTTKKSADAAINTTTATTTIVTSEEEMATFDDAAVMTDVSDIQAGPSGEWEAQTDIGDENGEDGVAPLTLADCMRAFTAVETLGEKIVSILSVYLTVISCFILSTLSLMYTVVLLVLRQETRHSEAVFHFHATQCAHFALEAL